MASNGSGSGASSRPSARTASPHAPADTALPHFVNPAHGQHVQQHVRQPVRGRGPAEVPGFRGEVALQPSWSCPPPSAGGYRGFPSTTLHYSRDGLSFTADMPGHPPQPRNDSMHEPLGRHMAGGHYPARLPNGLPGGASSDHSGGYYTPPASSYRQPGGTPSTDTDGQLHQEPPMGGMGASGGVPGGADAGNIVAPTIEGQVRPRPSGGSVAAGAPSGGSAAAGTPSGWSASAGSAAQPHAFMIRPPHSDTPTPTTRSFEQVRYSPSTSTSRQATRGTPRASAFVPPSGRRPRGSRSPSPKRRASPAGPAVAVAATTTAGGDAETAGGPPLVAVMKAVAAGFKTLDGKLDKLGSTLNHLSQLVGVNTAKVDALAVTHQKTANAQASAQVSTTTTLQDFRGELSGMLVAAAAAASASATTSAPPSGEAPPGDGTGAGEGIVDDDDSDTRALVMSIRVCAECSWTPQDYHLPP